METKLCGCGLCGKICNGVRGLACHISVHNYTKEQYYNQFFKKENDGVCAQCGNQTKLISISDGYRKYCSSKCAQNDPENRIKIENARKKNNPNQFILDLPENIEQMYKYPKSLLNRQLKCQMCEKAFSDYKKLTNHVMLRHKVHSKTYYDYFFRKENEGICYCGKQCNFEHFLYNRFCSISCAISSKDVQKKMRDTCKKRTGFDFGSQSQESKLKAKLTYIGRTGYDNPSKNPAIKQKKIDSFRDKYGTDYGFQSKEVKEKIKESMVKKHGVTNISYSEENKKKVSDAWNDHTEQQNDEINKKRQDTYSERTGYNNPMKNPLVVEQVIQTNREQRGVDWAIQDPSVIEKGKQTNLKNRGVEWSMQDPEVRSKARRNSFQKKEYILPSGKVILLQGYEPHFLDYVFSNNLLKEDEIDYYPERIKYFTSDGKTHYYFCDFRIIPFNLYVEVKDSYILSIQENTDLKIKATKDLGCNYIMILDKEYNDFKNLIDQFKIKRD